MNKTNSQLPEVKLPDNRINWFSRHHLWGYAFLVLAFLLAVSFIYQMEYGKKTNEAQICIQVITPAKNNQSGEVKDFPTPCDVPEGWEKIDSSAEIIPASEEKQTYSNKDFGIEFDYPGNWRIEGVIENGGFNIILDTAKPTYRLYNIVHFGSYQNIEKRSLKSFSTTLYGNVDKTENISINNISAIKLSGFNLMNYTTPWTAVCLEQLNKIYCFDAQEDNLGNIETMLQIASTFKFVN
jgi:hypothetical protein